MTPVYDIVEYGAIPGGGKDNSAVFADIGARIRKEGAGTILVPAGEFLTGPIDLGDNTRLRIEKGATLRFIDEPELYNPVETRWEGMICHAMHPLIFARNACNVVLDGEGCIDGNGKSWWDTHRAEKAAHQKGPRTPIEKKLAGLNHYNGHEPSGGGGREAQFLRPPLVQFLSCTSVRIEGLRFVDSPFWTIHPVFCQGLVISGVSIRNPPDAPNTDGIDIDSSSDVTITGTRVDVGDDCIALKAGSGVQGLHEGHASRNISISGCTFLSGHGGVVIGSETAGGIENVDVVNCLFKGSDRGIRIKSRRGRGGMIQNLTFRNLLMDKVLTPLTINMYYNCGSRADEAAFLFSASKQEVTNQTPQARNIVISNLVATDCRASAGFVIGLPEAGIEGLRLENWQVSIADRDLVPVEKAEMYQGLDGYPDRGIRIENAQVSMLNVKIENCEGPDVITGRGAKVAPA
ncbi:MAG: glycoside hydrolase family 28 protein [Spirochaetaceae bacterium]|nr:glycoside hydrolase family 28 protein [Spirochaetaceae bacterium]